MGQLSLDALAAETGVTIVFDGDCPLCRSYARRQRLGPGLGTPKLINARTHPSLYRALAARGIDLDQGMVVAFDGTLYYGAEAISVLARHSAGASRAGRLLIDRPLAQPWLARRLYPVMRALRRASLRLLGKRSIGAEAGAEAQDPNSRPIS